MPLHHEPHETQADQRTCPEAGQGWAGMMPQTSRKGNDKKLDLARVELATFSVWG